jgi:hypothetical protein
MSGLKEASYSFSVGSTNLRHALSGIGMLPRPVVVTGVLLATEANTRAQKRQ